MLGRDLFAAEPQGGRTVLQEVPWGRIERIADGVWALVSTPLEDRRTLCNGGIVAGSSGVVLIEAFGSPEGAMWMAEQARALTGRWPDHVLVTHYHGDHSSGLPGVMDPDPVPAIRMTAHTLERTRETATSADQTPLLRALEAVTLLPADGETVLDLGGRRVRFVPRMGHTGSDVTLEIDDPSVVFCGDLVWHRYFPNYVDARPGELTRAVAALTRDRSTTYVPGHGPLADSAELELYRRLLDEVEAQARSAVEAGRTAEEAASAFQLSAPLSDWFLFSDAYPERALGAWMRELGSGDP